MEEAMRGHFLLISATAIMALAGCTQMGKDDRALLIETRNMAQDAKVQAMQAAQRADAASQNAARAAAAAEAASERADRIFQRGGDK